MRDLPRRLGLFDSINIVAGTMIGSAIFIVPSIIAQNVPDPPVILAMWLAAGLASMLGALIFAELGAMLPASGGQYVYLREALGPLWGFLCGWSFFLVVRTAGTAAIAAAFVTYLAQFVPMSPAASRILAAGVILGLTWVNYRGVRPGATLQNILTCLKLLGIGLLIAGAFLYGEHSALSREAPPVSFSANQFGAAMIGCIFAYSGWFSLGMMGGEVKNPERNLPLACVIGVALVTVVYLFCNLAYFQALTVREIAGSERVAETAAIHTLGAFGSVMVTVTILISTLGSANSTVMSGARVYFAQARDGLFFQPLGDIHPVRETPYISLFGAGVWSAILALTGSYSQLIAYSTFILWFLNCAVAVALMVLRRKRPQAPRPYRMHGYPATAVLFLGISCFVTLFTFSSAPVTSAIGMCVLIAGVPVYYAWSRTEARRASEP